MLQRSKARLRPTATATATAAAAIKRRARGALAWALRVRTVNAVNALAACILTYVAWNVYHAGTSSSGGGHRRSMRRQVDARAVFGHAGYVHARSPGDAPVAARALFRNQEDGDGDSSGVQDTTRHVHPVSFAELLAAAPDLAHAPPGDLPSHLTVRERDRTRKLPPLAHAFALVQSGCRVQWGAFLHHARVYNLRAHRVDVRRARAVNLHSPPIPLDPVLARIASHSRGQRSHAHLRRHIAYLAAHRRAWAKLVDWRLPYALISDSHIFPSEVAMDKVNRWIADASATNPWHVLLLRRMQPKGHGFGEADAEAGGMGELVEVAQTSIGASAYVVSYEGARLLLDNVRAYRGSMDEEIRRLKRELGAGLVVLAPHCAKRIVCEDFTADIMSDRARRKFNCAWRVVDEQQLIRRLESTS